MAAVDRQLRLLPQRQKSARKWGGGVDPDQRFGPNARRRRDPEQGMTAADAADVDRRIFAKHSFDEGGFDPLNPSTIGPEAPIADEDCNRDGVYPEDLRPPPSHRFQKRLNRRRFYCHEDSGVDRGNCVRMAASERDQVLVRLFGFPEPLAQPRNRTIFELDQLSHA